MAVYTPLSKEEIEEHLKTFNIGELESFSGISEGIDNTNYKITTSTGAFILTIFEKRIREEDLPFYISFTKHLYDHGLPCPDIIKNKNNEQISRLKNKPSAIASFLEGKSPSHIEMFHIEEMGKVLGKMHLAVKDFKLTHTNAMSVSACRKLIDSCGQDVEQLETGLFSLMQKEFDFQEKNMIKDLPSGVIHGDLFPNNVFFNEENKLSGIFDFYFSCTDCFVFDLMTALTAWSSNKKGELDRKKMSAFLDAYKTERPLSPEEEKSLTFFGRVSALRFLSSRTYDWFNTPSDAFVERNDPIEYINILKFYQTEGF